jgi:ABC-type antimicrobial peptide transport system permease subunit
VYHGAVLSYLLRISLVQLVRYRAQSLLAILGVAVGVANIITLISITDLGKHQSTAFMNHMGANMLIVSPFIDFTSGMFSNITPAQASQFLPASAVEELQGAQGIDGVVGVALLPGHVGLGDKRWFTTLEGVSQPYQELRGDEVRHGRWFTPAEAAQHARVACLGDTVRQQLFGDKSGVGEHVVIKGQRFEVLAAMASAGRLGLEDIDNRVFMPLGTALELFGFDGIQGLFLRYRQGFSEQQAIAVTRERLKPLIKPGEDIDEVVSIWTLKDATKMMDNTLGVFRIVLIGISSIAMLVAGIGIMNVMLMRVVTRKLEIGIRRSVGATAASILTQFLAESVVQAIAGLLLGIALGLAGVALYCSYAHWDLYISPATVVLAVAFSAGTGIVFGAYPAYRAALLDPVQCLRG